MKTIEIIGKNYSGAVKKTRVGCRCIIRDGGKLLLSYEKLNDIWMLPGGGLEPGESEEECCKREVAEETGMLIDASGPLFEIDEYYEDTRYVSVYFSGGIVGRTRRKPTKAEIAAGMEPRWLPIDETIGIFSHHEDYAGTDEMTRGMYLREYTALIGFFGVRG